jgi:hypothetical protein
MPIVEIDQSKINEINQSSLVPQRTNKGAAVMDQQTKVDFHQSIISRATKEPPMAMPIDPF